MQDFHSLLQWFSQQANVRPLAIARDLHRGFSQVRVTFDGTFFGIDPQITNSSIKDYQTAAEARRHNYLSEDFDDTYFNRARRLALEMIQISREEGFEFYNGRLARFKGANITEGKSPSDDILELDIGHTSYFTSLGTNIHVSGYNYQKCSFPYEDALPDSLKWALSEDWRLALRTSPFANPLAIHLFLYNDQEIIYVRRGQVGQQSRRWNTSVNGVMEFSDDASDIRDGKPDIGETARRESFYELGIDIQSEKIRWLGLGVTMDRCEPVILGVYQIDETSAQVAKKVMTTQEQKEIGDRYHRGHHGLLGKIIRARPRGKEIRSLPIKSKLPTETFPVPYFGEVPNLKDFRLLADVSRAIEEKILLRKELTRVRRDDGEWTDSGAVALLLCLAHCYGAETLQPILERLKNNYQVNRCNTYANL